MIVLDASAVLEVLLHTPSAAAIRRRLFNPPQELYAPHLIDLEVAQVLRRYALAGSIAHDFGGQALRTLADLPLQRASHNALLPRIWTLRNNLTAYDAAYVTLAELLDAPLITRDRRLAVASGHRARIELV